MKKPMQVLAAGLGHPEGPDFLPDGGLVFVETYTSRLGVWYEGKGVSTFCDCGGGPNACMLGSDDHVYITQNGGTVGEWVADKPAPPSIQKSSLDGKVEVVATEIEGIALTAPNDLTWGTDGKLYFTDSGVWDPVNKPDHGYVFALNPDGSGEVVIDLGPVYPNGITTERDGSLVWVESYTRKVRRRRPDGTLEDLYQLAEGHIPDGLKVDEQGNLWVTAFSGGGVDVVAPDGSYVDFLETGGVPLNCIFGGTSLYITDFGTADTSTALMTGRLVKVDVGVSGMPLYRGSVG